MLRTWVKFCSIWAEITGRYDLTIMIKTLPSFKFDVSIEHVKFEQLQLFATIFSF